MTNKQKALERERIRLRKSQNPQQIDYKKMDKIRSVKTEFWKVKKKGVVAEKKASTKQAAKKSKPEKEKKKKVKEPELEIVDEEPELEVIEEEPEIEEIDEELDELYSYDEELDEEIDDEEVEETSE